MTAAVPAELSLSSASDPVAGLQQLSSAQLTAVGEAALRGLAPPMNPALGLRSFPRIGSQPIREGVVLRTDAWVHAAPAESRHVPMLVGTVREEFIDPALDLTEEQLHERLRSGYRDKADAVLSAPAYN